MKITQGDVTNKWHVVSAPDPAEPPGLDDTGRALLAGVVADPESDAPRLVFADYLDERAADRGEPVPCPRADLIRLRCGAQFVVSASLTEFLGAVRDITTAETGLSAKLFATGWLPRGTDPHFARGFLTDLRCPWDTWAAHGDGLRDREWVPRVTLTSAPDWDTFDVRTDPQNRKAFQTEVAGVWVPSGVVGVSWHDALALLLSGRWPGTEFVILPPAFDELKLEAKKLTGVANVTAELFIGLAAWDQMVSEVAATFDVPADLMGPLTNGGNVTGGGSKE